MQRYLILEDGSTYAGEAFGATTITTGEVVFTTGMTGYQEAITDQSYADQILVFTNPLIGNYGINVDDNEALNPQIKGVICHQVARHPSNWRMQESLPAFLKRQGIPGLMGVDTRQLVKQIRAHGILRGKLVDSLDKQRAVVAELKMVHPTVGASRRAATPTPYPNPGSKRNIVVIDFGLKHSILRELAQRDCNTIVLPANVSAQAVLDYHPDGVLLSNGPGDPTEQTAAIKMVAEIEQHVPVFGICMGHQVFALANGAQTFQMKFGHRGFNHPVKNLATGEITFTSQNHGYAVAPDSLSETALTVTHLEINDGVIEGLKHQKYPAFSVQFHPDAAPGPHDAAGLFDQFVATVDAVKEEKAHA